MTADAKPGPPPPAARRRRSRAFEFNALEPWHIPVSWALPYNPMMRQVKREELAARWLTAYGQQASPEAVRALVPFTCLSRIDSMQAIVSDLFVRQGVRITHSKLEKYRRLDDEGLEVVRRGRGERVLALDVGSRERLRETLHAFLAIDHVPTVTTLASHMRWGKTSTRGALLILGDTEPYLTRRIDVDGD